MTSKASLMMAAAIALSASNFEGPRSGFRESRVSSISKEERRSRTKKKKEAKKRRK